MNENKWQRTIYKKKKNPQFQYNFFCFCCGFLTAMIIAVILVNM